MVSDKAIRQGLYEKLNTAPVTSLLGSGSASLVHAGAPSSAAYPLCVYQKQSGRADLMGFGGPGARNQLWLVKGVVRSTKASLAEDIDKAVADLLHFSSLTIAGGESMYLAREGDVNYSEVVGDQTYWHVGSLYRLRVQ